MPWRHDSTAHWDSGWPGVNVRVVQATPGADGGSEPAHLLGFSLTSGSTTATDFLEKKARGVTTVALEARWARTGVRLQAEEVEAVHCILVKRSAGGGKADEVSRGEVDWCLRN